MIIEKIEIGKIWEGGFNDYHFQCRPAGSTEPFDVGTMYFEDFEAWREGVTTIEGMKDVFFPEVYKMLKEMKKRA